MALPLIGLAAGGGAAVSEKEKADRQAKEKAAADERLRNEALETRRLDLIKQAEEARNADMAKGRARGEELFGNQGLGRVQDQRVAEISDLINKRKEQAATAGQRSADVASIIAQRKAGLGGFNAEENAAQRAQMQNQIGQQEQGAMRQLLGAQGASGVRGGVATAQQMMANQGFAKQRAQAEQDLFLKNIAEKQNRLGALEQSVTGAETNEFGRSQQTQGALEAAVERARADELGRQQFNLGQVAKEKLGILGTETGYAGLGSADRSAAGQQVAAEKGNELMSELAKKGKK